MTPATSARATAPLPRSLLIVVMPIGHPVSLVTESAPAKLQRATPLSEWSSAHQKGREARVGWLNPADLIETSRPSGRSPGVFRSCRTLPVEPSLAHLSLSTE